MVCIAHIQYFFRDQQFVEYAMATVDCVSSRYWSSSVNTHLHIRRFTNTKPSKYVKIWLTKAPVAFLAISAVSFIAGLNCFSFSSNQVSIVPTSCQLFINQCAPDEQGGAVSIAMIALTSAHIIGIMAMLAWFIVRLEWNKTYFRYIRRNILWWVDSLRYYFSHI